MAKLSFILGFAWKYLRRYWGRFLLGILFGILFGLSNASFIWATRIITERLAPESASLRQPASPDSSAGQPPAEKRGLRHLTREKAKEFRAQLAGWEKDLKQRLDPWLPQTGRTLDWRQILGGLLFLPILVSIRSSAGYSSSYFMSWVSERAVNDLRYDVLAKLSALSIDFFNRSRTGDLITRINNDSGALQRTLRVGFADLIKESITIVTIFIGLCILDWKLTFFSMIFLPLCLAPLFVLGRKARKASKSGIKASVSQSSQLVELFSGIRIIKAFGLEAEQLARFRRLSKELVRQAMKGVKAKELVNPIIEVVSTGAIGVLIVYLFWTGRRIEDLVGFLTGLLIFYSPVKRMAAIHVMFEQTSVSVVRLIEILQETPSVQEPVAPKPIRSFSRSIEFDAVNFCYLPNQPVLRDLSLSIARGFKLGVAGPSGSGKSTLVNLLLRFYDPTSGAVRLDGADLRELATADLRQLMALVTQETVLFDMTVAENIACGKPGATRQEIEAAADGAHAHEFIGRLPQGYDTPIGERGVTLSGGQRQRLAIARAFVRNAPILILDEATASLDAQAEAEVQDAINHLAEHRTVIAVAHRLSTLANMDEIIFLSEGRLVEKGTFSELLENNAGFADMAKRQGISHAKNFR